MLDREQRLSRRKFMASAAAGLGVASAAAGEPEGEEAPPLSRTRPAKPSIKGRKPLAVITTVYRPLSHSYHIAGRFIHGYARGGKLHVPKQYIHSMFVHQTPENDLSRDVAKEFGIKITRTIEDALTSGGKLAVEGVLLIGEHGNYPRNDKGQILYPRFEWMEQIAAVFRKVGKSVPVFNDKHLSYTFDKAKKMLACGRQLKFPMMAGSSLPVVWRRPELELKLDTPVEDALVAAYGPIEIYGFHALETLQVMMERRKGGETGVKAVTCLTGKDVWKAGDAGKWSWDLLEAALARSEIRQHRRHPQEHRQHEGARPSRRAAHRLSRSSIATARAARCCCSTATCATSSSPRRSRASRSPPRACSSCRRRPGRASSTPRSPTSKSSSRPARPPTPWSERC